MGDPERRNLILGHGIDLSHDPIDDRWREENEYDHHHQETEKETVRARHTSYHLLVR